jgi:hypothetical protein
MTKNNLLNAAIVICKVLQSAYILVFVVLTAFFIHIQVDKEFYKDKAVTINKTSISYTASNTIDSDDNIKLKLDQMTTTSLYVTYFRYSCLLILLFLSIREFKKIMKSVQSLKTFRNDNVKSFRRIGQYVFVYFLLSSFYSYQFNEVGYSGFALSFTPLIVMLLAFIMAEIFKEGNLLLEDKELTI